MTTLLLLHGLGASGSAWGPLRDALAWDGPVLAPDLPGHGSAARLPSYDPALVAVTVASALDVTGPLVVLGHSYGGVVGLALSRRVPVERVVALGVKDSWPVSDVERFAALATRPPRVLPTREEALALAAKVAGAPAGPTSVVEGEGGWQLALDPRVWAQTDPDLPGLVAAAPCPVQLLRGADDPMTSTGDALPGLGHNAHVEDPVTVLRAAGLPAR